MIIVALRCKAISYNDSEKNCVDVCVSVSSGRRNELKSFALNVSGSW